MSGPNRLRNIPSVSELLESPQLKSLIDRVSHNVVVETARSLVDDLRTEVKRAADATIVPPVADLAERIARRILREEQPKLRSVINATGILLHTGLGRAPLAEEAVEEMALIARGYASVEMDLETGLRSHRMDAVAGQLARLTGAESALVVNNNAGATLLALAALAADREVVVARGQLVEIGGSYRLPDVMEASQARLCEVGTTNKVRASDYEDAIGEQTAAILRVHTSNFRVVGFTSDVPLNDLVGIGREHGIPVIDDIGSGALVDFTSFGCPGEPLAKESIRSGADLVLISGDKLLGGPQCGIVLGRRKLVESITKHPLARALRVDKLTLAALHATLRLYRDPETAMQSIPLLQLVSTAQDNLRGRAERLAPQLAACSALESAEAVPDVAYLGGGSLPNQELKTWCIALIPAQSTTERLAQSLRLGTPSVVGRIQNDRLLLDLRGVFPHQDQQLLEVIERLSAGSEADTDGEDSP